MRTVFADTAYWIAMASPHDQCREAAKRATEALGNARILTTDEVLSEFLTVLRSGGPNVRREAVRMVRAIIGNPNVKVVPQTRDSFLTGLELYEQRPDKEYSLIDCVSMNVMRAEEITDVLTNDHHFEQEGFRILMRRRNPAG